jgi:hypothetical protein
VDLQPGLERLQDGGSPVVRQPAARGRDADQERVGRLREGQGFGQRPDHGNVVAGEPLADITARNGRVENRDRPIGCVADHAHRRLGVVRAELALGQDHQPSRRVHGREV